MESNWKLFRRTWFAELRPYRKGENLSDVAVYGKDKPIKDLGYIARHPVNHKRQWYVSKSDFEKYFEEA